MKKIIGLTYDIKTDWQVNSDEPFDTNAEFDKPETIEAVTSALEKGGHTVVPIGNVHQLISQIDELDVDIVFNLCEGRRGRNRESQVPILLELKGIPYVGSDALTFGMTLDKNIAKKFFIANNIPTAKAFVARSSADCRQAAHLTYPLMVKTLYEGSSKGICEQSRVQNLQELIQRVEVIHNDYGQPALVEEFISGAEFTVAVLGNENPKAMPVVQYEIDGQLNLGNRMYTANHLKENSVGYICPAKISEELTMRLQTEALKVYTAVECRDFGRVDFRVDENENIYTLECNPLPSLEIGDCFSVFPPVFGSNYDEAINSIVNIGLIRYGLVDQSEEQQPVMNSEKVSAL